MLLYFHGGGYCFCSMHSHRKLVGHLAKAAGCRALNVDYRLAPEHPHPAALTDALAAYRWLLEQGIEARPTSSSPATRPAAGIALALLVKARDEGVPLPAAGVLMSPWVDLAMTADSLTTRADVDVRQDPAGTRGARTCSSPARIRATPMPHRSTRISPACRRCTSRPATGTSSSTTRIASPTRPGAAGVDVRLDVFPEMLHAHQIWAGNMPEADDAVARIGEYVRQRLARDAERAHRERAGDVPGRRCALSRDRPRCRSSSSRAPPTSEASPRSSSVSTPTSPSPRIPRLPRCRRRHPATPTRACSTRTSRSSFVAAQTSLKIATCVALVAQHDPIALAKTLATLDHLSDGRLTLGVGYGWNRDELANHGHGLRSIAGRSCGSTSS